MKKSVFLIILTILVSTILIFAGCSKKEQSSDIQLIQNDPATSSENNQVTEPNFRIGLVMKTLTNPFFIDMEKGAREAALEENVKLIVKTGAKETSIEQQITIIQDMIKDKMDAIVIAPGSSTELVPVLAEAQEAGIKVINIDNRLDPGVCKKYGLNAPFISVDNMKGAYLSAQYMCQMMNKPGEIIILEGIRNAQNAIDRRKGAIKAINEFDGMSIVASETANWKIDEAYNVAARLIQEHPNVKGVFCANDMMALGVIQYLEKSNRKDILVAGFDDLEEAEVAIINGKMIATIDQQAAKQGYLGIKAAIKALNNQENESMILVDVKLVTLENI